MGLFDIINQRSMATTPDQQSNAFSSVLGGASNAIAPMMGRTSQPVSMGQVLAAFGGGAAQGLQQARHQNLGEQSQATQMQLVKQKLADAKAASAAAAAEAQRITKFRQNNPDFKNMPLDLIKEQIKAGKNPFGGGTAGKMYEYYSQGPSSPNYKIAVKYLSQPQMMNTPNGMMVIPPTVNPDGTLIASPSQAAPPSPAPNATAPQSSGGTPAAPSFVPGTDVASKKTAELEATASVEEKQQKKADDKSYGVFKTALTSVIDAFGKTETGWFAGKLPAVTTGQQNLDIAVSQIFPTLKQLFREKGEGTFTDADQKAIIDLIPGRGTNQEAAVSAFKQIDAIVRQKLGMPLPPQETGGMRIISRTPKAN